MKRSAVAAIAAAVLAGSAALTAAGPGCATRGRAVDSARYDTVPIGPVAGELADAAAAAAAPPPTRAGIACGDASCVAHDQICCQGYRPVVDTAVDTCAPHPRPEADNTWLNTTYNACAASLDAGVPLTGLSMKECDDSSDCATGSVCCRTSAGGGQAEPFLCQPLEPHYPALSCDFDEVCTDGAACAIPGARCRNGSCVPPRNEHIACGTETCSPERPLCCALPDGSSRFCAKGSRCPDEDDVGYECTRAADCSPERCESASGSLVPRFACGHYGVDELALCESDADCSGFCPVGAARCLPSQTSRVPERYCQCQ